MKLQLFLIAHLLLLAPFCYGQSVNAPLQAPGNYQLVWADEFTTNGPPNPANWTYERGFVRNNELQWYQPDNARCQNGFLVIEARRENRPNPTYSAGSSVWNTSRPTIQYSSACLITRGLHSWQYGRFEMRGRIDTRAGLWPAFWTLGQTGQWPSNGEIDIMEYYRNMLLANVAWGTSTQYKAEWRTVRKPVDMFNDPGWASKFHIWRMDWDETAIALYVDDTLLNRVNLSETINTDGSGFNPFRQPHYILLDLAVGGDQGGDPSATVFPGRFEVDYVRVYQKQ
ncbi:glycoside hydrolase family 16 protein [Fibrella sp. HMF5335]|uniref:Glycoside hydrolase family 16 protein n=1 Tax=Fibrella rubiginis TaxID=2817060 RepID=A0A939GFN0_9BACT|nr:glycoside hydrolase family 16 protein [Fibrella rubiginis]MBO0935642.1 glycoside hydrolase family 16 protein [Fibrella rubiginis]